MTRDFAKLEQALKAHLDGLSYRKAAIKYNVPLTTLWKWAKKYNSGEFYKKPWNRPSRDIEEKVMLLKENMPSLSVNEARKTLKKQSIKISARGIYEIWKRYNLVKRSVSDPLSPFGLLLPETKCALEYVTFLLEKGKDKTNLREATRIINCLPSYPNAYKELLNKIPERLLAPRRRMERLYDLFLKIPLPQYLKKLRAVRRVLVKKGLFYSAMIAGLSEIRALHFTHAPEQELRLCSLLERKKYHMHDPVVNFVLSLYMATTHTELLRIDKAYKYAARCRVLLRYLPYSSFYEAYGDLMTFLSDYKKSLPFYQKALTEPPDEEVKLRLLNRLATSYIIAGMYHTGREILKKTKIKSSNEYFYNYTFNRALLSFSTGEFEKASFFLRQTLEKSEKHQLRNYIYGSVLCLSAMAKALGKAKEASTLLKKYLPLLSKYRLKREVSVIECLLAKKINKKRFEKLPLFRLLSLLIQAQCTLTAKNYKKVLSYAEKKGLSGFLHRTIVFFPEPVLSLLYKGQDPHLPKVILKFPVFNIMTPVYHLRFLGRIIIYRNQQYLKIDLDPKEIAFVIYAGQCASEPQKFLLLDEIYKNFWPKSKNPASQFTHLLFHIKQKLKIPKHLFEVSHAYEEKKIFNRGIRFTTDYNDFEISLVQAKALERAGEWDFARKEYLRAFKLFRGEPFKKMYDPWSEQMRRVILNRLETEAIHFAKSCLEHDNDIRQKKRRTPSAKCRGGNMADAKKVLEKVAKIIPGSEEIITLIKTCSVPARVGETG